MKYFQSVLQTYFSWPWNLLVNARRDRAKSLLSGGILKYYAAHELNTQLGQDLFILEVDLTPWTFTKLNFWGVWYEASCQGFNLSGVQIPLRERWMEHWVWKVFCLFPSFLSFSFFLFFLTFLFINNVWQFPSSLFFCEVVHGVQVSLSSHFFCGRGKSLFVLLEDTVAFPADLQIILANFIVNK